MTEKHIFIESKENKIEALLEDLPGENCVIVTHPHPLYGGDMNNHVVESVCAAYRERGFSTLRFNFRGVGESDGVYDNGIGEQEDVSAAINFMEGLGKKNIHLAGYSFGAWVNYLGIEKYDSVRKMVMVSPPVGFLDFSCNIPNPKIKLVITGSNDDVADPEKIKKIVYQWNPEAIFKIIKGTDHFYMGSNSEINDIIYEFLEKELP